MMDADRYFALNRLKGDCRVFAPRDKSEMLGLALDQGLPPAVATEIANAYDPRKGAESLPRVEWRDEPEGDNLLAVLRMFKLED
jgi:hypothetical protein